MRRKRHWFQVSSASDVTMQHFVSSRLQKSNTQTFLFPLIDVKNRATSRRGLVRLVRLGKLQTNDYTSASSLVGVIFEFFAL